VRTTSFLRCTLLVSFTFCFFSRKPTRNQAKSKTNDVCVCMQQQKCSLPVTEDGKEYNLDTLLSSSFSLSVFLLVFTLRPATCKNSSSEFSFTIMDCQFGTRFKKSLIIPIMDPEARFPVENTAMRTPGTHIRSARTTQSTQAPLASVDGGSVFTDEVRLTEGCDGPLYTKHTTSKLARETRWMHTSCKPWR
jgi:hypothetical protein